MSNAVGVILAIGIVAGIIIVCFAIANHIARSRKVEFHTPYCLVKSSQ